MTLVVDASVAVKWVLWEAGSAEALALTSQDLIAPPLLRVECANALWSAHRRGEITGAEAQAKLNDLVSGGVEFREADMAEALRLALQLAHAVYDCVYLALARVEGVAMVTADEKFASKVEAAGLGANLRRLGTFREGVRSDQP